MTGQVEDTFGSVEKSEEYVSVIIHGQYFGLAIHQVQDVFIPIVITEVPLSSSEIAGVLNLRGRIVTAIDMRERLNLPPREPGQPSMAVGIELNGESYCLIIDKVGEVLNLSDSKHEKNPANLDPRWACVAAGVQRLDNKLMVILDVNRVLAIGKSSKAA